MWKFFFDVVNRDFALLHAAMVYARDRRTPPKVLRVPFFPRTSDRDNARQGFLKHDKYVTKRDAFNERRIQRSGHPTSVHHWLQPWMPFRRPSSDGMEHG